MRCSKNLLLQNLFSSDYADPFLKNPQASRTRLRWTRSCRQAPEAPRRSWSCWWSASPSVCSFAYLGATLNSIEFERLIRTNFDKYHPGYFGKVGMRHFHLTRNMYWRPTINVDKLWSLVPTEEKKDLTETSEVVPVIDTLHHGYGKVLGNGVLVQCFNSLSFAH